MNDFAFRIINDNKNNTALAFAGQAGFVIKSETGQLLGIDLYLTDCGRKEYGFKRLMPYILAPDEIVFDCVIATHEHFDHFDYDAMPALLANSKTKLVAAEDCRRLVEKLGLQASNPVYIQNGDNTEIGDFNIQAVFCDHGKDTPWAVGLVITVDNKKIYIAGDTCLRLDKVESINRFGPFDIMIAPINGAFGNLNEYEMVSLCREIKPGLVIPCHYWNFAEHGGNPGIFMNEMESKLPNQKYLVMGMGEVISI